VDRVFPDNPGNKLSLWLAVLLDHLIFMGCLRGCNAHLIGACDTDPLNLCLIIEVDGANIFILVDNDFAMNLKV
jgi:hypothetical protein